MTADEKRGFYSVLTCMVCFLLIVLGGLYLTLH